MTEPTTFLSDSEFVEGLDAAEVAFFYEQDSDDHSDDLRQQALTMFTRHTIPVRDNTNMVIGSFVVMECNICSGPVLPIAKSMITHMRQHLKAERRGEYNNA